MSVCGCFSPSPRLGKVSTFEADLEPPELLYFTDKQNRFSQEVLLGLQGQTAPTQYVSFLCQIAASRTSLQNACLIQLWLLHVACPDYAFCMHLGPVE